MKFLERLRTFFMVSKLLDVSLVFLGLILLFSVYINLSTNELNIKNYQTIINTTEIMDSIPNNYTKGLRTIIFRYERENLSLISKLFYKKKNDEEVSFYFEPLLLIEIVIDKEPIHPLNYYKTIYHEIGHHIWNTKLTFKEKMKYRQLYYKQKNTERITIYASKNVKEGFAEEFSYYHIKGFKLKNNMTKTHESYFKNITTRILS